MAPDPQPLQGGEPSHSGRLLLRMPRTLHAELAARSEAAGVSLNQFIVATLSTATSEVIASAAPAERAARVPRSLRLALVANAIVVALAAGTVILVLALGWR
jgi:hypothetical protein